MTRTHPITSHAPHRPVGRPRRTSRILAAFSYLLGSFALLVVAIGPKNPFLVRHAQQGMVIHVVRLALVSTTMIVWYAAAPEETTSPISTFTLHFAMLTLVGFPWPLNFSSELLLGLALPLGASWLLGVVGAAIAVRGLSLDLSAALRVRWPDWVDDSVPEIGTPEYDRMIGLRGGHPEMQNANMSAAALSTVERRIARDIRDRRLERIWDASQVAVQERSRQELLQELEKRQETVLVRLDHLNHLLSGGEISLTRFNRFNRELIEYLDGLRAVRAQLRTRADGGGKAYGELPMPPDAMTNAPDAEAITLAIIDSTGVPVVTYGHFSLDESLISGMVSVMDGLSEEMFGSRANKTYLSDGEVVYFAQGQHVSAFVTFDDEPSPVQIARIREFLDAFESANSDRLHRPPIDAALITEVRIPFRFARRIPAHAR